MSQVEWRWPVHLEPKNLTMDKKLCIVVCPTGALITRKQNPYQPYTPEEVAKEVIEAYKEGAYMAHLHIRNEKGLPNYTPEAMKKTLDIIFEKCPDIIAAPSISAAPKDPSQGLYEVETIKPWVEKLLEYGSKYMESTVVTPISYVSQRATVLGAPIFVRRATESNLKAEVEYLQSRGVKPEFMAHNFEAIENIKEWLIKLGVLKEPYFITLSQGMHHSAPTGPDPWGILYLITMKQMLPENTIVGVSIGGRNWLPITTLAIMLGAVFIRVGKEDTMWLYPHKDSIMKTSAEAVKKIVTIAKELGRDIATPDEARKMLGIK